MSRGLASLLCLVAGAALMPAAGTQAALPPVPVPTSPAGAMVKADPVHIEEADRILRARMRGRSSPAIDPSPAASAAALPHASPVAAMTSSSTSCGTSSQPLEITTLAASLKCDLDLIYEYVYNNIEYEPLFGSNKGALGTLLDQRGNDIDQARLFIALLSAAGYSPSQINLQYGYIRLNATTASAWLGVANDGQAIANVLSNGGIPIANGTLNKDGTLSSLDVAHVWAQVTIGGTAYVFDPSFKQHTVQAGLNDLAAVLGYTQGAFLSAAGGTIDSVSIADIDRTGLRNTLVSYASNLIAHIKATEPGWSLDDVIGGKRIQYLTGSPLRQTSLSYLSPSQPKGFPQNWGASVPDAYRTCFTISMPGVTQTLCGSASSQTIELFADDTYGKRITLFSTGISCAPPSGSCTPTLLIDGSAPPNGQHTGTAASYGASWTVNVAITHPYTGSLATAANQSRGLTIAAGGSYLVSAGWGGRIGRGMIEGHRKRLMEATAAGGAAGLEPVLGESLAVISYTWLAQVSSVQDLSDRLGMLTTQYHHGVGITAQTAIQGQSANQGPYVDLPLNFRTMQSQTDTGAGFSASEVGTFFARSGVSSSLESAVLEQTQAFVAGMQAASTIRLVDINAATAAKTYFADGTTSGGLSAYFSSIRPNLTSTYSKGDLAFIDSSISSNGLSTGNPTGKQALLPASGNISVGVWQGAGYTVIQQTSTSLSSLQRISGGLSGGFSGSNVPTVTAVQSTQREMRPASGSPSVPVILAQAPTPGSPTIAEPIAAITGAYLYQHTDLITGSSGFPYALAFARSYSSAANATDVGLGRGWRSNYGISATRSSDPFAGLGESGPIAAAGAIAALYVAQDLLSGTQSAQTMTAAWLASDWLTDQLTNNSVLITWPDTNESFTLLPRPEGSATGTYAAPLGSAVVLTGSAPDAYGNFTVFSYVEKDQTRLDFNAVDATGQGSLASWAFPNGMRLDLAYGYSHGGSSYLSAVTNNLGRSLTLSYSGAHVTSVTDDTGRSVAYGYDASADLVTFSDAMGYRTAYAYDGAGRMTQLFYPSFPSIPFFTNSYDTLGRVSRQTDAHGNPWDFYFAGSRSETIDAAGNRHVTYQSPRGKVIKDAWVLDAGFGAVFNDTAQQNGMVNVATNQYDGQDRLILATAPEGGTVGYAYSLDFKHNVVAVTRTPKPGSGLSARVTRYAYDPTYSKPTLITDPLGRVTEMSYDAATGNLLTVVADAGGLPHLNARSSFTYTGTGQVLTATDPLGTLTLSSYDANGNVIQVTRDYGRLNQVTRMGYDALGNLVSATDPNGNVTRTAYDANRRVTTVTAPQSPASTEALETRTAYDPDGRVLETATGSGELTITNRATYTASGKLATTTDAKGNVTRYEYDVLDRVASITDPLARVTRYEYDALSRRTGVFNTAIQVQALLAQTYTPDGRLASLTDANGNATAYAYDGFDRLSTTTYPDTSAESQSYDANDNILTRITRAGQTFSFAYDTLNRLSTKTPPSPAPVVSYSYDLAGRVIGVSDTSSSIVSAVPPTGTTVQYASTATYDQLNRPLAFGFSPAPSQTAPSASTVTFAHGYNAVDQRISQAITDNTWVQYPAGPSSTSYTANSLNQYTAVGATTPTYDGNGNLTYDGTFSYCYDAENRLVRVITSGTCASPGTTVASYAYDAQGRRKSKTVGGTTTIYVTDADNREILEYDGSTGQIQAWYAYGAGLDVLNRIDVPANTRQTFIPDIQGSVVATLASNTGALTKRNYLPFGESATTTGSFAYTGLRIDPETHGLYYARARIYSPTLGRFLQPDPIGYADGANLYRYVGNDPLNLIDPEGTCPNCIVGAIAGVTTGAAIAWLSGTSYGWRNAAFDAATGAIGAGLVSKANQLRRISELRSVAQSRGLQSAGQKGYTETWKDATGGLERLQIKHQAGTAPGLEAGSRQPRFAYRIDAGKYWDPFTGTVGPKGALSHVPLEPVLPGVAAATGGGAVLGREAMFGSESAWGGGYESSVGTGK